MRDVHGILIAPGDRAVIVFHDKLAGHNRLLTGTVSSVEPECCVLQNEKHGPVLCKYSTRILVYEEAVDGED